MKNTIKLLLIVLVLSGHQTTRAEQHNFKDNFKLSCFYGLLGSLTKIVIMEYQLRKAPDIPPIVKQFCYKKFKDQGLKTAQLTIKVINGHWLTAYGTSCIIFGPAAAFELKTALENPTDEDSIATVNMYSIFLDHEMSHLIHKDGPAKSLAVYTGTILLCLSVSAYIMDVSRFSYLFYSNTPTGKKYIDEKPKETWPHFFLSLGAIILSNHIYSRYAQSQEKRADAYAMALAKNPDGLRHAANALEFNEKQLASLLSNATFDITSPFNSLILIALKKVYATCYYLRKPKGPFHSWVKRQPLTPTFIRWFCDPEHPSGYVRAEAMRHAADKLEAC